MNTVCPYEKHMSLFLDTFRFNQMVKVQMVMLMSSLLRVSEITSLKELMNVHVKVITSADVLKGSRK